MLFYNLTPKLFGKFGSFGMVSAFSFHTKFWDLFFKPTTSTLFTRLSQLFLWWLANLWPYMVINDGLSFYFERSRSESSHPVSFFLARDSEVNAPESTFQPILNSLKGISFLRLFRAIHPNNTIQSPSTKFSYYDPLRII